MSWTRTILILFALSVALPITAWAQDADGEEERR